MIGVEMLGDRMLGDRARSPSAGRIDWILVVAALGLALVGAVLIWSAISGRSGPGDSAGAAPSWYVQRHLVSVGVGGLAAIGIVAAGQHTVRVWIPLLYLGVVVGLVIAATVGIAAGGSRRWIGLPFGVTIQPGELAKPVVIVAMAYLLAEVVDRRRARPRLRHAVVALAAAGVPAGLLLTQPDLGTAVVLGAAGFGVLVLAGTGLGVLGVIVAAAGVAGAVGSRFVADYQMERIAVFLDPSADPGGIGYNAAQAQVTIGGGGLFGQGLLHGARTGGAFVPEQHTDFIFTVAGEELGFVGSVAIIGLFAVLLWRGVRIARAASDIFGRLAAGGVVCWFTVQTFQNIGMTLGLTPITGVPLPLVSYGGSSVVSVLVAVGLLQAIAAERSRG